LVLAAGASRRLGEPKQLVTIAGERLLDRAVRVAREAELEPVIVVLGAEAERVLRECQLGDARVVVNEGWSEGMGASIRVGIAAVPEGFSVVVMTCDQPAVSAAHLRLLIETGSSGGIAASAYADRIGVPAFFPESELGCLAGLAGDRGARGLLAGALPVELAGGEVDVDTAEALEAARRLFGR
jgi:CTP:molybdopterin cytidylyltransferase MocA